jgi:hypothetical protein
MVKQRRRSRHTPSRAVPSTTLAVTRWLCSPSGRQRCSRHAGLRRHVSLLRHRDEACAADDAADLLPPPRATLKQHAALQRVHLRRRRGTRPHRTPEQRQRWCFGWRRRLSSGGTERLRCPRRVSARPARRQRQREADVAQVRRQVVVRVRRHNRGRSHHVCQSSGSESTVPGLQRGHRRDGTRRRPVPDNRHAGVQSRRYSATGCSATAEHPPRHCFTSERVDERVRRTQLLRQRGTVAARHRSGGVPGLKYSRGRRAVRCVCAPCAALFVDALCCGCFG